MTTEKEMLSVDDLAERWGCSAETVLRHVNDPENPLAAVSIGMPTGAKRRRHMLRFRLATVRQFERERERILAPGKPAEEPTGRGAYEGKIHTRPPGSHRAKR